MGYRVAVVGATGAVGQRMLAVLEQRAFPADAVLPLASSRSAGKTVTFRGQELTVAELRTDSFSGIDLALFSAGGSVSTRFAPAAAAAGAIVVDNTSAFRMDDDVPLVVPEVNGAAALDAPRGIIANPNCSTIQMVVALGPLHASARIRRIVVSTYQAVSGAGARAIEELRAQAAAFVAGAEAPKPQVFAHAILFDCLPQIGEFDAEGYTVEEMKLVHETRKIFADPTIEVCPTAVRVPVMVGHGEALNVSFEHAISPEQARELLSKAPGVIVRDVPAESIYPRAREAEGQDPVYVGRIRKDPSLPHGLNLWVVADNLRKGAATNAVQIAEYLHQEGALGRAR